ncbi:Glycosyl hydrolase family 26, partial [Frankia sp. EI5c]|uniref:glycosyl hydrolase n=1 Tax=Frankia sp. EI5c TaxID=683316 RepID=UPI0007C38C14
MEGRRGRSGEAGTSDEPATGSGGSTHDGSGDGPGSGPGHRRGTRSQWAAGPPGPPGATGRARQRRVLLLGAVSAVVAVVVLAVGIIVFTGDEEKTPTTHPTTTGVSWVSGANANPPNDLAAWESWVGRSTDIAILFTSRANWETVTRDDWPLADFRPQTYSGQVSIAQPLLVEGSNEAACARGEYDSHWRDFGNTLVRNGRPDAIVRLGWEFNGNWFKFWEPKDTGTWKVCFTRAAASIRSTAPQVKIEWTMTAHRDTMVNGDNVWDAYPGDDVVDIIGIDAYDSSPASLTQKIFNEQCNRDSG